VAADVLDEHLRRALEVADVAVIAQEGREELGLHLPRFPGVEEAV